MREYVIMTDTNGDVPEGYITENGIEVVSLSYILEGETYDRTNPLPVKEFYDKMRNGSMPTTSQVNPDQARECMEKHLKEGKDVLYIAFSSGLSGTYNSGRIAMEELMEENIYPEQKVIVIDTLSASLGQGLLVHKAVEMKKAGKSMEEVATWVEENKLKVVQVFTVDDLFHLQRGGRVSKATAVIGTMINIKPLLCVNEEGGLVASGKVRGRKKSIQALVETMRTNLNPNESDVIAISNGDCLEDAQYLEKLIRDEFDVKEVIMGSICPSIGAHSGPGTIALFFFGEKR